MLCHGRVVLRVMEVPLLAVALEALRGNGEPLWDARRVQPRMALLGTGRPLSFTWTPDGRGIVAVPIRHSALAAELRAVHGPPLCCSCSLVRRLDGYTSQAYHCSILLLNR